MRNCRRSIYAGFIFLLLSGVEEYAEARMDLIPGSRFTSSRGAAMGDAFLPVGDDAGSGLFYNPANLGKIRKNEFEPLNLSLLGNSGLISSFDYSTVFQVGNLSSYAPVLDQNPGAYTSFGGALLPNISFAGEGSLPSVSMGLLYQFQNAARSNGDGTYTYRSLSQLIPTLGTGFRWFNGLVRFGYSLQWVNQTSGTKTVPASSLSNYSNGMDQGSGISHNFGLALTLPVRSLPSLNVVVRNAFETSFNRYSLLSFASNSAGAPANDPMTIDASFELQPKLGRGVSMNLVAQGRDLTNRSGTAWMAHLALGAELNFSNYLFLRGGWGSGYPSAGAGVKQKNGEFSLSWSSAELGSHYLSQRDVQYMLQYQVRAF
jgi:hypothetical protein